MAIKVWMLNTLILLALLSAGYHAYRIWNSETPGYTLISSKPSPSKVIPESLPELSKPRLREEYQGIADNNLFSQTRSPEIPVEPDIPVERSTANETSAKDRYVLYGTVSINGERYHALIKDRKSAGSKTRTFNIGDRLPGNETITDINKKKVLIESPSGKTELRLRSPKGPEDTSFVPTPVPAGKPQVQQRTIRRTPVPANRSSSRVRRPRQQTPQPSQISSMPQENLPGFPQDEENMYPEEEQEEYPAGYPEITSGGGQP